MEDSMQIAALTQRFHESTTAWKEQEEETARLQQQLEKAKQKQNELLEEMQRAKARVDKALEYIVSGHNHAHPPLSTTSSTEELVESKITVDVASESKKKEAIDQTKSADTESSLETSKNDNNNDNEFLAASKTCSSKDAAAILQNAAPIDGDDDHSEKTSASEMPSEETAMAQPPVAQNVNGQQVVQPALKVGQACQSVQGFVIGQFLSQNHQQVCNILKSTPRTPSGEILRIELGKGPIPDHIQQQHGILPGVQRTRARAGESKFIIALDGEKLTHSRLGLNSSWTNFEDPRDASKALEAVEELFRSYKQNQEEEDAVAATPSSSPQKRARVGEVEDEPSTVASTPSHSTRQRTPRLSAEKAKQKINKECSKKTENDLDKLKEEHQKLRPFPLAERKRLKPCLLVGKVVSYRHDPNHWQLFRIAECAFERNQVRLKEFSDDDGNPPPAGFVDVQHVFLVSEIGLVDGYGVCIECGTLYDHEKEENSEPDSVQCEGCSACFHFKCVQIVSALPENRHWICYLCTQEQKHEMKQNHRVIQ